MLHAYRLASRRFGTVDLAFSGISGLRVPGRWTRVGHRVIYCSSSVGGALSELLVHLPNANDVRAVLKDLVLFSLTIPDDSLVLTYAPDQLPAEWSAVPGGAKTQQLGSDWLLRQASPVLRVPSAVLPGEWNILLNPEHPRFDISWIAPPRPAIDLSPAAWSSGVPKGRQRRAHISAYDAFISHASEDATGIVEPLVESLLAHGVKVWYSKHQLKWGDSITDRINDGLKKCRYVIVVLSPAFMNKSWPKREMNAALEKEADTGVVRVLPLFVGSESEIKKIRSQLPLQADKLYLRWTGSAQQVTENFLRLLST